MRQGNNAKDANAGKQDDLSRQIQRLSTEINEAMRSGDRSKVSILMRQRDQLQQTRGCVKPRAMADSSQQHPNPHPHPHPQAIIEKEQAEADVEPALKRART